MSENKQHITQEQENGTVIISEDVIAEIVTLAIADVEGVAGLNAKTGSDIIEIIGVKNWGRGLKVLINEENELSIDCSINVKYGHVVFDVAKAAQEAIISAVESMTGIRTTAVNINVCNIIR